MGECFDIVNHMLKTHRTGEILCRNRMVGRRSIWKCRIGSRSTEYSLAEYHWPLISRALGINVSADSPAEERYKATLALRKAWNLILTGACLFSDQIFGSYKTNMGHASYAADGGDYDDKISCPFEDPEDVLEFDPWAVYGPLTRPRCGLSLNSTTGITSAPPG